MVAILAQTGFPARNRGSSVYVPSAKKLGRPRKAPILQGDYEDEKPEPYTPAPITLPAVNTHTVTDLMVGLDDDPQAQEAAETYIRQTIAWKRKQAEKELTMTETETMLIAIDEGYARRTELMEKIGELNVNTPAMLCAINMIAETDRTIREAKRNHLIVSVLEEA